MTDLSGTPSSSTMLRWTTLIAIVANAAFIAVYSGLSEMPTIAEVAAEFGDSFLPAGFVRGICVAMLAAFLLFYVAALWPRRRRRSAYDKLVLPLALTSVLASCWIVAFRHEQIGLSVALIAAGVALSGLMFARVASVSPRKHSLWLRVPFSLHLATMTVALLVAVTQWLSASGLFTWAAAGSDDVAIALLAIATATGGFVALRYGDFVYPAVMAAAAGAIFVAQNVVHPEVAVHALVVCVGMLVVVTLAAVALALQPPRARKERPSRRRKKVARSKLDESWYALDGTSSMMGL